MFNTNKNLAATRPGCSRMIAETVVFTVVWWLISLAALHYILHMSDDWNAVIPILAIGPVFWFILRILPKAGEHE